MTNMDVTIITGASRGIGEAIARKLVIENHLVILLGRDEVKLKSLFNEINSFGSADYFAGDINDVDFIKSVVESVIEKHGRIDHLINNAGIMIIKKIIDASVDEFIQQMNTNVISVFNFTKIVLPYMISQKSGSIINISSLAGKNSFVGGTMYSTTKHALMGFTKSLMLEVREHNIRVAAVCPGSVSTDLLLNSPMNPKDKTKILQPSTTMRLFSSIIKLPPMRSSVRLK
ncbi:MAG: SDR family oxidoreductase [Ignavibacteriaceae bacterium]|nr:SDR family oxidoreductase [Ignavibacteriaceae bacterium]